MCQEWPPRDTWLFAGREVAEIKLLFSQWAQSQGGEGQPRVKVRPAASGSPTRPFVRPPIPSAWSSGRKGGGQLRARPPGARQPLWDCVVGGQTQQPPFLRGSRSISLPHVGSRHETTSLRPNFMGPVIWVGMAPAKGAGS